MTMNSSGPISLGGATTGQSINLEIGSPATSNVSLNDTIVRTLAGKPTVATEIVMPTDFYGKSLASGYAMWVRFSPNRPVNNGDYSRTNVLKAPDSLIVQFFSRGQQSFPTGTYVNGESATVRVDETTGNILWSDAYTYGNATGPGAGTTVLQTSRMALNPAGTSIFQYDSFTSNRPPVSPIQGYYTQTRIIKNLSNGVPTSFNMAANVFAQTSAFAWNFANGNQIVSYAPTPSSGGSPFGAQGNYIVSPPGAIVGHPLRFSNVSSPTAVGGAFAAQISYADNATKTDVISAYSGFAIPPGSTGATPPPGNGSRDFTLYARTTQDGSVPYARWIAYGGQNGTRGDYNVLSSPPACSWHVGLKTFLGTFPQTGLQGTNNLMFWRYNKSDGEFTGNAFYWSNQYTTPSNTTTNPFATSVGLNSSLGPTGRFLNINNGNYSAPNVFDITLRFFDSNPTFNNYASYIATGRSGGTVVPTNNFTGGLQFGAENHNSENFGNTIFEDGDFMYLLFSFRSLTQDGTVNPWDVCILKTKKDGSGITDGLTVTSSTFNKSITFTTLANRPLYETPGWIGGTVNTAFPTIAFPGWNTAAPRINLPSTTYASQKVT